MTPTPPSAGRALWLLTRIAARQLWNRLTIRLQRRTKGKRSATVARKGGMGWWMVLLSPFFLWVLFSMAAMMVGRIAAEIQDQADPAQQEDWFTRDGFARIEVSWSFRFALERSLQQGGTDQEARLQELVDEELVRADRDYNRGDRYYFDGEITDHGRQHREQLLEVARTRGEDGFRETTFDRHRYSSGIGEWPTGEAEWQLLRAVGLLFLTLFAAFFFQRLGAGNKELYQTGWTLEWLFCFPVSARGLFLSRLAEATLVHPVVWMFCFPVLTLLYWPRMGFLGLPLAAVGTLYVSTLLAALTVCTEVIARKRMALSRTRNLQALCTLLGLLLLYAAMYSAFAETLPAWLVTPSWFPSAALWFPPVLPVLLPSTSVSAPLVMATMVGLAGVTLLAAERLCSWLVRDGLTSGGGMLRGTRGAGRRRAAPAPGPSWLRGIVRKELLLLIRDRGLMVQTLVVPALILGFQVLINPTLLRMAATETRRAAAFGFGVSSYVLLFTGITVLNSEGRAVWMLYTAPETLARQLRRKTYLWSGIGVLYGLLALVIILDRVPPLNAENVMTLGLMLVGTVIYGFIACGLGCLYSDPLKVDLRRSMPVGPSYLYMLLAGAFGYALYSQQMPMLRIVIPVLCALTAVAIWQRVTDHLPYLLDPGSRPRPSLSLGVGLVAILAFYLLQGALVGVTHYFTDASQSASSGAIVTVCFFLVGGTISLFCWLVLDHRGIEGLGRTLGLVWSSRPARTILQGAAMGLLTGFLGIAYMVALTRTTALQEFVQFPGLPEDLSPLGLGLGWRIALMIVAAPLFEEFLFRGVVLRGLRRSLGPLAAAFASAALFAIVHPPQSMIPVFVLGVGCALVVQRTGSLLAPITTHAVYNVAILLAWSRILPSS